MFALRVSHVLEETVRRSGSKLHVNAQLVDTRTDEDIWADEYERDLNDVFAVETEVAQSIAKRLRAKLSARERAAIQERPTKYCCLRFLCPRDSIYCGGR